MEWPAISYLFSGNRSPWNPGKIQSKMNPNKPSRDSNNIRKLWTTNWVVSESTSINSLLALQSSRRCVTWKVNDREENVSSTSAHLSLSLTDSKFDTMFYTECNILEIYCGNTWPRLSTSYRHRIYYYYTIGYIYDEGNPCMTLSLLQWL